MLSPTAPLPSPRRIVTPESPPTVLLVEDYPETRAIFRLVLEAAGFEVLESASAEDGLDQAFDEHPDVILTDLMMPGMSGVDAARILRSGPATEDIPIVAATGSVAARTLPYETRRWFVEVLEKPVQPAELVRAVREALLDRDDHQGSSDRP